MRVMLAIFALAGLSFGAPIPTVVLPNVFAIDSAIKVRYVYENDTVMANRIIQIRDSVNADTVTNLIKSLGSLRLTLDNDANATGHRLAITHNGGADTLAQVRDDSTLVAVKGSFSGTLGVTGVTSLLGRLDISNTQAEQRITSTVASNPSFLKFTSNSVVGHIAKEGTSGIDFMTGGSAGALQLVNATDLPVEIGVNGALVARFASSATTIANAITAASTLGVTGKVTGSDTVAAVLGFRAGNTAASNVNLYRSGADMWTTPDSMTVAGKVVADTLISPKFYTDSSFTATLSGVTTTVTGTVYYVRIGKLVTLKIPDISGTSNSTSMTLTGMPASIRPSTILMISGTFDGNCTDNGSINVACSIFLETDGTIKYTGPSSGSFTSFTASATKGTGGPYGALQSWTYTLQ